MDEYKQVQKQMQQIIDKRKDVTIEQQKWDYNREVGKSLQTQPFKYHKVEQATNVDFTDDIRKLIYNEKVFPDDNRVFTASDWQLAPVTQNILTPPTIIPSGSYLRNKKSQSKQAELFYGKIQMEGRLKGKSNQINYNNYHYNLRSNALVIYKSQQPDDGEKQQFFIPLNQNSFDYLSDATDFFFLKGEDKSLRILKDQVSRELIDKLEKKGAYAFRNQVPHWKVADYINQQIDFVGPINLQNQNHIKDIINVKPYRQAIGGFCKLLQKSSRKRNNKAGQINYPRWLKQQFRDVPRMQTWLSTNVIPPQHALMSLKVKVNMNQKNGLLHIMKYVFPYLGTYVKRSLVVYESELVDQDCRRILENVSYPMYMIGFPHNDLSVKALEHGIYKSSDFQNQVLDFSHNSKLLTIGGSKVLNLTNSNPTVKKIHLKGCQISNGQHDIFFDALSSNMVLEEIQLDYNENYNESMTHFLEEFQAAIE